MPEPMEAVTGRFTVTAIRRLDRIAEALSAKIPALGPRPAITRTDALRAAVERGLDALERELGLDPPEAAKAMKAAKRGGKPARKP